MIEKTTVGVIVGRFQVPTLHEAHLELIRSVCDRHMKVIVFLGLSPVVCTTNNPLDFEARKQMLLSSFPDINVLYIKDIPSDEKWSKKLDEQIEDLISPNQKPILYGSRDSFIEHYAGKYETEELESKSFVSGTQIRREISAKVKSSSDFRNGVIWAVYNQYPTVFTTVDVAILDNLEDPSKVLLGRKPMESKFRFIGGFSTPGSKTFEEDARREVIEETGGIEIQGMEYICTSFIEDWRYMNESSKIKTIFYKTQYIFGRPEGSDDIAEVRWFDIKDLTGCDIMKCHHILFVMLMENIGKDEPK